MVNLLAYAIWQSTEHLPSALKVPPSSLQCQQYNGGIAPSPVHKQSELLRDRTMKEKKTAECASRRQDQSLFLGNQFSLFLLSSCQRILGEVASPVCALWHVRTALVCHAMPATLRLLDFHLRCFNGFENCCVCSEICHHGIEACVAYEWLVHLLWKFNSYNVYRTTFVTSRLCKTFCLYL